MERAEKAARHFAAGFNCAQSVLLPYAEEAGLSCDQAARLASALGGGMGRAGETCGAVSGAAVVIGLLLGPAHPADRAAKERCYAAARRFVHAFQQRHRGLRCRELLGVDIGTPEGRRSFHEHRMVETHCTHFVCDAVAILEEILASQ
ncbi:MAG: C-GCAxxG-C-C family protein [Armatimonadota bacterium]|nr:C-GCAxxG-C-C family protein [Armatimonadota bacterium]